MVSPPIDSRDETIGADPAAPTRAGDTVSTARERDLEAELGTALAERDAAVRQSIRWRTVALERWSDLMGGATDAGHRIEAENHHLREENRALKATLSWRVTKPLRLIHERFPPSRDGK
jgi:hypothetical protein